MPIEIRELIIKATLEEAQPPPDSAASGSAAAATNGANTESLVNLVVEKVMEILREKQER
ncbi:DUF5908 family protein [Spirosoma panaciterrae]|uniref:DUF5908 family protein n=1 Tax=Spirosoma panaciterrae TaxID=496058 RepID=UPI00035D6B7E|nr:DUF5908 family protein [Spirosoma panaciterrae]